MKREAGMVSDACLERARKRGRPAGGGGPTAAAEACAAQLVATGALSPSRLCEARVARALGLVGGGATERVLQRTVSHHTRLRSLVAMDLRKAAGVRGVPNVHIGVAVCSARDATRLLCVRAGFLAADWTPRSLLLRVEPAGADESRLGAAVASALQEVDICAQSHVASVTVAGMSGKLCDGAGKDVFPPSVPVERCFLELVDVALARAFRVGERGDIAERKGLTGAVELLRQTQRLRWVGDDGGVSVRELDAMERLEAGLEDGADRWTAVSRSIGTLLSNWHGAMAEYSARRVDTEEMGSCWTRLQHLHAVVAPFADLMDVLEKGFGNAVEAALTVAGFRASILRLEVALPVDDGRTVPHDQLDTGARLVRESLAENIGRATHATSASRVVACALHPALKSLRYLDAAMPRGSDATAATEREAAWRVLCDRVRRAMHGDQTVRDAAHATGPEAKFAALGFADIAAGDRPGGVKREPGGVEACEKGEARSGVEGGATRVGGEMDAAAQMVERYRGMRAEKLSDVMVGGAGDWWSARAGDTRMDALCAVAHGAVGAPASAYSACVPRDWVESASGAGATRAGTLLTLRAWLRS